MRSSLIPGFRFHPTDVELVMFYLKRKLLGKKITVKAVAEVNIYAFSPWDLPDKSVLKNGDLEWYFFCPKAKKYASGCRSSRSTETGFWKATGKDRQVSYNGRTVATIKTLVFHLGHAGKGQRTNWVMHEYKMEDAHLANAGIVQDMYVLCKIFEKSGSGPKNGAHYGKPFDEEEWKDDIATCIDSDVSGLVGASDRIDNQQMGRATMKMTEPGSSTVTSLEDGFTNILNDKQKGLGATNITEPGSSAVTFSADQATYSLNGPAVTNMVEPQIANGGVMCLEDIDQVAADAVLSFNDDDDVMFSEDVDVIMGSEELVEAADVEKVKSSMVVSTKDDGTFEGLGNLVDLDDLNGIDFKTDIDTYARDKLLSFDDLDVSLEDFYVD